jgi:hypothetical protein
MLLLCAGIVGLFVSMLVAARPLLVLFCGALLLP